jgi:hypothetical protein
MSPPGVPEGTRWANKELYWKTTDHIILPVHIGNAKDNVITRCLEAVKT